MTHKSQEETEAGKIARLILWVKKNPWLVVVLFGTNAATGGFGTEAANLFRTTKIDSMFVVSKSTQDDVKSLKEGMKELRGAFLEMPGADSSMARYHKNQMEFKRQFELYGPTAAIEKQGYFANPR